MEKNMYKGKISRIDLKNGFGFINSYAHEEIYFSLRFLKNEAGEGDEVVYKVGRSRNVANALEAWNVRKIYRSKNGTKVIEGEKTILSPEVREALFPALSELIIDPENEIRHYTYDSGHTVNPVNCVEVGPEDRIFYAKLKNKNKYYKFVEGRNSSRSGVLTTNIRKQNGYHTVCGAYFGDPSEPFPWDKIADSVRSRAFWENHALVPTKEFEILEDTITYEVPEEIKGYL